MTSSIRKGRRIMAGILCAFLFSGLFGCRKKPADDPSPEVIDGGTHTERDPNAPKVIESKELTEFSAFVFLATRWRGDEIRSFDFRVKPDGNGTAAASEEITGISLPADDALLTALAEIIAKYDLASRNGLYDVTYGLPEEYQAYPFRAVYASGETLSFTVNNNPYAAWAEEVYDVFAAWFSARGIDDLEPESDGTPVMRFSLEFSEGGHSIRYTGITVREDKAIDGETHLLGKLVSGTEEEEQYRLFPEDYFEKITAVIRSSDLEKNYEFSCYDREAGNMGNHDRGYYGMGALTTADNEPDAEDLRLDMYLEFESGNRINVETKKASEIEGMRPLLDALTEYLDSLFR